MEEIPGKKPVDRAPAYMPDSEHMKGARSILWHEPDNFNQNTKNPGEHILEGATVYKLEGISLPY